MASLKMCLSFCWLSRIFRGFPIIVEEPLRQGKGEMNYSKVLPRKRNDTSDGVNELKKVT